MGLPELSVDEDEPGGVERLAHNADLPDELVLAGRCRSPAGLDDLRDGKDRQERERPGDGQRDRQRHLVVRSRGVEEHE
jgi:hypothetical protein